MPMPPFWGWTRCTPALPEFYNDLYSREQDLKTMNVLLKKMGDYLVQLGDEVNVDREEYNKLIAAFEQFMESGFDDYYKQQIAEWISANMLTIMKEVLQNGVFFGLTEDGYFCANVMNQLNVQFDTIQDYSDENYGHLIIKY